MMMGRPVHEIQAEADARNAISSARPGPYQHWYVHTYGGRSCLTAEMRRIPVMTRVRMWLVKRLGGDPDMMA